MEKIIAFRQSLNKTCSFMDAWDKVTPNGKSCREMGYIRAYLRNGWHHITVMSAQSLVTKERMQELRDITSQFYRAFPTLDSLRIFCEGNAEATSHSKEFNLYLNGKLADYWIRVNTTENDHNLYLYSIVKGSQEVA